jgi:hypothetical protein
MIFHSYVSLPEGNVGKTRRNHQESLVYKVVPIKWLCLVVDNPH